MIELDEGLVRTSLEPLLHDARFERAITNLTNDRLFLSIFLMTVSLGEGFGEAGVNAVGQEEVAQLMHNLRLQELEEHGHMDGTRMLVEELFPEHFEGDRYRYEHGLVGVEYYFTVREANRRRLRERDRYSRLNLYLTTTFAYEIMVELLYATVIEALATSALPRVMTDRIVFVLTVILRQEETHLGIIAQHNALCAADRAGLSAAAAGTLGQLERLTGEDYEWTAELAVQEIVRAMSEYADPAELRARLELRAPLA